MTVTFSWIEQTQTHKIEFKIPVYRNTGKVPPYDPTDNFTAVQKKILDMEAPPLQVKRWALLCKGDLRTPRIKNKFDLKSYLGNSSAFAKGTLSLEPFRSNLKDNVVFTWELEEVDEFSQEICDPYSGRQDNDLVLIPKENKSQVYTKDMLRTQETWEESQAMLNVNDTDAHMTWSESTSFQNFVIRDLLRDRNFFIIGHGYLDTVSQSVLR